MQCNVRCRKPSSRLISGCNKIVNNHKNSFGTGNVALSLLLNLFYSCINMLIVSISSVSARRNRTEDNIINFVTNIYTCLSCSHILITFGHDL